MTRIVFILLNLTLTTVAFASETANSNQFIKKKCVSSEILEICYANNNCTQAPCANNVKCHQESEHENSATCLPTNSTDNNNSISVNSSINLNLINYSFSKF